MPGREHGPETQETARRLDEIADRLGKLQAQLDERQPLYERELGHETPAADAPDDDA